VKHLERGGRGKRNSCLDDKVCASSVISNRKKLKTLWTRPSSLEMAPFTQSRGIGRLDVLWNPHNILPIYGRSKF
jgi:hypothetical protein